MLIMRTYALYERSKRILAFTVFVTVSTVVFGLVSVFSTRFPSGSQGDAVYVNDREPSEHVELSIESIRMSYAHFPSIVRYYLFSHACTQFFSASGTYVRSHLSLSSRWPENFH